jgi:hypothetical protein
MTTTNTADIIPNLIRIWEIERQINLGGGTDKHVSWCHSTINRMALDMTDEQKMALNARIEQHLDIISRSMGT